MIHTSHYIKPLSDRRIFIPLIISLLFVPYVDRKFKRPSLPGLAWLA
jgi:hypothetical protein